MGYLNQSKKFLIHSEGLIFNGFFDELENNKVLEEILLEGTVLIESKLQSLGHCKKLSYQVQSTKDYFPFEEKSLVNLEQLTTSSVLLS